VLLMQRTFHGGGALSRGEPGASVSSAVPCTGSIALENAYRCEVGYDTEVTCRSSDAQPTCHSNGSPNGCQSTGVVGHTLLGEFADRTERLLRAIGGR
jgi:hypothetical protein